MLPGVNRFLYGFHEPSSLDALPQGAGWFLHLAEVGDNDDPHPGVNLSKYTDQGYGTICRLQYSWSGGGTFPLPDKLDVYVERVRTLVANSRGCHIWQIGNEPNHPNEWSNGSGYTPSCTPAYSAQVYDRCWSAIHATPGHQDDEVLLAPCAPWIVVGGVDWIEYFTRMIDYCATIDGFAVHTYSRDSAHPFSITSPSRMNPPHERYSNNWQTLSDWLNVIPAPFRTRPVYLTETNQGDRPWSNINTGWVSAMYAELDRHNQAGGQVVRCALLYRWPHHDQWGIEGNQAIIDDMHAAIAHKYTWVETEPPIKPPPGGDMPELQNPSFEEGWHEQDAGELVLPDGWALEYVDGNHPWCGPDGKRPEVKPNQEFVTDGQYSIRAFPPAHSRGMFGIFQEIQVEQGEWYTFTAQARIESNPPGDMAAFVGIQPWGAGLFERQMIWGKETRIIGEWQIVTVTAQAFGSRIRVAMGANNKWATTNNTVWWDDSAIEKWECTAPPVDPPDPPLPGDPVDYGRIAQIVEDALVDRGPVVWPPVA